MRRDDLILDIELAKMDAIILARKVRALTIGAVLLLVGLFMIAIKVF